MKKTIIILAAATAAAAAVLTGCTHESTDTNADGVEVRIKAGVGTKASGATWDGDHIGVTVTSAPSDSYMATDYVNSEYSTTSTGTTADFTYEGLNNRILFDTDGTVTFAAYAPYQSSDAENVLPGTNEDGVISGTVDGQSSDQESIDWLYAAGVSTDETNPVVTLTFTHVMSMIVINVEAGTGVTAAKVQNGTYTLDGLTLTGAFVVDPASANVGTAYSDGTATSDWSVNTNFASSTLYDSVDTATEIGISYNAIVYPQTMPSSLTFTATMDELPYEVDLAGSSITSFDAGKTYTFNLTLTEIALTMSGCTITDWATGGSWDKEVLPGSVNQ